MLNQIPAFFWYLSQLCGRVGKTSILPRSSEISVVVAGIAALLASSSSHADIPEMIKLGGDATYPPFEFSRKGEVRGFNVELARALGQAGDRQVTCELGDWPEIMAEFEKGNLDIVPMLVSEERAERFLFSPPIYVVNHAIYAAEGTTPIYGVDELEGRLVAVEDRSYAQQRLEELGIDAVTILAANTPEALEAVQQKRADYAVLATPSASRSIGDLDLKVDRLGPPFWSRPYAFAELCERKDLLLWMQDALDSAVASGAYRSVHDKWRKDLPDAYVGQYGPRLWPPIAGVLLLLVVAGFVYLHRLRRNAEARAEQFRHRSDAAEAVAAYLHDNDGETGLAKTNAFLDQVDRSIAGRRHEVLDDPTRDMLVVELTRLSELLHILGRERVNELVKEFAANLRSRCKGPVGYLGRGVFALFSSRENIRDLHQQMLLTQGRADQTLYSRAVAGLARFPEHGGSAVELLKSAETALTVSRATGRQWAIYSPAMEPDENDFEILECLRSGHLEGLHPVFQPKLDLASGTITGAEALVRWNHPRLGAIFPTQFIPLAERAGLVSFVTSRMIDEAVRLSSMLRKEGLPSSISVNISISDLTETDLSNVVQEALQRHGGNAGDLHLELTETSVASDFERTRDVLVQLHALGIGLSVDDFGTGFASLSYLSVFPIDEVKIDRTFVADMVTNARNRSIVRSTVLMAKELGLRTVAEGAEDAETQAMLSAFGCDQLQGYVLSKPLGEVEYRRLIEERANSSACDYASVCTPTADHSPDLSGNPSRSVESTRH
ncbi:EAL domain-containing protein [Proteobacteria bacterium 005FR1]|nr:EAL domain-containing protein [Proteobacteria bacterium 005FR1]